MDGCYVPPRFMDRVAVHVVKNHVADLHQSEGRGSGGIGAVPLILGIWGEKGCGKSYTLELCLRYGFALRKEGDGGSSEGLNEILRVI